MIKKENAPVVADEDARKTETDDSSHCFMSQDDGSSADVHACCSPYDGPRTNSIAKDVVEAILEGELPVMDGLVFDDEAVSLANIRERVLVTVNARVDREIMAATVEAGDKGAEKKLREKGLVYLSCLPPELAARIIVAKRGIRSVVPTESAIHMDAKGRVCIYECDPMSRRYGTWRAVDVNIDGLDWACELCPSPSAKWVKEFAGFVVEIARTKERRIALCRDKDLVWLANGIFNYRTKELMSFTPELVSYIKARAVWHGGEPPMPCHELLRDGEPTGEFIDADEWLDSLVDAETKLRLLEAMGAGLRPRVVWECMAYLYNEHGSSGKSTVIRAVTSMCGEMGIDWLETSLETLCGCGNHGRFGLSGAIMAGLFVCSDSDGQLYIPASAQFKKIMSHEPFESEAKYEQPTSVAIDSFILCAGNHLPHFKDKSDAIASRLRFYAINGKFDRLHGAEDKSIRDEWVCSQEFSDWLAWKVLAGIPDYYRLEESATSVAIRREWKYEDDTVADFFETVINALPSKTSPDADGLWADFISTSAAFAYFEPWRKQYRPTSPTLNFRPFARSFIQAAEGTPGWARSGEKESATRHCNAVPGHPAGLMLWSLEDKRGNVTPVYARQQGRTRGIVRAYDDGEPAMPPTSVATTSLVNDVYAIGHFGIIKDEPVEPFPVCEDHRVEVVDQSTVVFDNGTVQRYGAAPMPEPHAPGALTNAELEALATFGRAYRDPETNELVAGHL